MAVIILKLWRKLVFNYFRNRSDYFFNITNPRTLVLSLSRKKEKVTNLCMNVKIVYDDVIRNVKLSKNNFDVFAIDIERARDHQTHNYLEGTNFELILIKARKYYLNEKDKPSSSNILNNCPNKEEILRIYNNDVCEIDALVGVRFYY